MTCRTEQDIIDAIDAELTGTEVCRADIDGRAAGNSAAGRHERWIEPPETIEVQWEGDDEPPYLLTGISEDSEGEAFDWSARLDEQDGGELTYRIEP